MNIFNAISDWRQDRYEKRIAEMKVIGHCPDCKGSGFISTLSSVYTPTFDSVFDCPGCNGSGQYSDWIAGEEPLN